MCGDGVGLAFRQLRRAGLTSSTAAAFVTLFTLWALAFAVSVVVKTSIRRFGSSDLGLQYTYYEESWLAHPEAFAVCAYVKR